MLPRFKVCEESHRATYIGALCSLSSVTKQQNESDAVSSEIHSISVPDVQPQLLNAITQELVITEIGRSEPINPT
jgi:hypothetical protein